MATGTAKNYRNHVPLAHALLGWFPKPVPLARALFAPKWACPRARALSALDVLLKPEFYAWLGYSLGGFCVIPWNISYRAFGSKYFVCRGFTFMISSCSDFHCTGKTFGELVPVLELSFLFSSVQS